MSRKERQREQDAKRKCQQREQVLNSNQTTGPAAARATHGAGPEHQGTESVRLRRQLKHTEQENSELKLALKRLVNFEQEKDEQLAAVVKERDEQLAALAKAKDDEIAAAVQAKEEQLAAVVKEKDEKLAILVKEKDEQLAALVKEKDEQFAAVVQEKDGHLAAVVREKDAQLSEILELAATLAYQNETQKLQLRLAEATHTAQTTMKRTKHLVERIAEQTESSDCSLQDKLLDAQATVTELRKGHAIQIAQLECQLAERSAELNWRLTTRTVCMGKVIGRLIDWALVSRAKCIARWRDATARNVNANLVTDHKRASGVCAMHQVLLGLDLNVKWYMVATWRSNWNQCIESPTRMTKAVGAAHAEQETMRKLEDESKMTPREMKKRKAAKAKEAKAAKAKEAMAAAEAKKLAADGSSGGADGEVEASKEALEAVQQGEAT